MFAVIEYFPNVFLDISLRTWSLQYDFIKYNFHIMKKIKI